jgi:hypothetical protein
MSSSRPQNDIQYLHCTVRHNTKHEVATVRFLLKAKEQYANHYRYFVAVGAQRDGGEPDLVEFSCLKRAYDDVNAVRLAKLRGTAVESVDDYTEIYESKIGEAVSKYFWLSDRFVPTTLEELVGDRELNLDDADTISSLNLSQCSGDTESDLKWEVARKLLVELGIPDERLNERLADQYNDLLSELNDEILASETTRQMLSVKYPTEAEGLKERFLAYWRLQTEELRALVSSGARTT